MTQDQIYRGYYKLIEEMGETLTELGKLGPFPTDDHPDGKGAIRDRLDKELTDVQAVIAYFRETNRMPMDVDRFREKLQKFLTWELTGINPEPDQK